MIEQFSAESGLIRCLIRFSAQTADLCLSYGISPAHFQEMPLRAVYVAAMAMVEKDEPVDLGSIVVKMRETGTLEGAGGSEAIFGLDTHALPSHLEFYAERVLAEAGRRALVEFCHSIQLRCADRFEETEELLDDAKRAIMSISISRPTKARSLNELLIDSLDRIQRSKGSGLSTGFDAIDRACGPWQPGNLIVVSGETKSGKSALARNVCENVAIAGGRVALFSLEMSPEEVSDGILASQSRVNLRSLLYAPPTEFELGRMCAAVQRLCGSELQVIPDAFTLPQIITRARQMHAAGALALVVVDYIQLVGGNQKRQDNREREVADVSRSLKRLAVDLGCVVIGLSQLNDQGKLRESRAIGQDANVVLNVDKIGENGDERCIRVVAARSAATGSPIPVKWIPQFTRFENSK